MLRFWGMLDAVLYKHKWKIHSLANAVLDTRANRVKTVPGMYDISRAGVTGTG